MLSRVADSLYWMSCFIERAENMARLLDVNLQMLLDYENLDEEKLVGHWESLLRTLDQKEVYNKHFDKITSESVSEFIAFSPENPSSIYSCILSARSNAGMIRDQISSEIWVSLNTAYHFLRSRDARDLWRNDPYTFFQRIREFSLMHQGLTDATFPHEQGYEFMQVGKFLERADNTSRILDTKYHIVLPDIKDVGGAVDLAQWTAILRSCSAYEAYHRIYVASIDPWKVADFLVLSKNFPRSVSFCVNEMDRSLRLISGSAPGTFSNTPERLSGKLLSHLNFGETSDIFQYGLHEYLVDLQVKLSEIAEAVYTTYVAVPD
jgi:uncharacterized alpha-E superfamily protein